MVYGFEKEPYKIHTEVVAQAITALSAVGELGISRSRYTNIVPTVGPRWMVMKMKEYVDKTALLAELALDDYPWSNYDDAYNTVQNMPTADVALVIHAKWEIGGVHGNGVIGNWKCSACKGVSLKDSAFCPHCGAKMEGGETSEAV